MNQLAFNQQQQKIWQASSAHETDLMDKLGQGICSRYGLTYNPNVSRDFEKRINQFVKVELI